MISNKEQILFTLNLLIKNRVNLIIKQVNDNPHIYADKNLHINADALSIYSTMIDKYSNG